MENLFTIYVIIVLLILFIQGSYFLQYYIHFKQKISLYYFLFILTTFAYILIYNTKFLNISNPVSNELNIVILKSLCCLMAAIYYIILQQLFEFKISNFKFYQYINISIIYTFILIPILFICYYLEINSKLILKITTLFAVPFYLYLLYVVWKSKKPFAKYVRYGILSLLIGISIPFLFGFAKDLNSFNNINAINIPSQVSLIIDTYFFGKAITVKSNS